MDIGSVSRPAYRPSVAGGFRCATSAAGLDEAGILAGPR
jgi:hypothetical protein